MKGLDWGILACGLVFLALGLQRFLGDGGGLEYLLAATCLLAAEAWRSRRARTAGGADGSGRSG